MKKIIFLILIFLTSCIPSYNHFNVKHNFIIKNNENDKAWNKANIWVFNQKYFGFYDVTKTNQYLIQTSNNQFQFIYLYVTREQKNENEYNYTICIYGLHENYSPEIKNEDYQANKKDKVTPTHYIDQSLIDFENYIKN